MTPKALERVVHYVDNVVTGSPACGVTLGLDVVATSTGAAVTCPACSERLGATALADPCTSCGLSRDHRDVAHRPTRHAVWCVWASCGHYIPRGDTACTKEHPQEGTPVSEPTDDKAPAKKAARKAAAPPPTKAVPDVEDLFTPAQRRRAEALTRAARLLDDGETRGTAGELIALARFIEGDHVDDLDDGGPGLAFVGAPTTSSTTTNTEGATQ